MKTLFDFFRGPLSEKGRLSFSPASHMIQSALRAQRAGHSEETVLACLLHDIGHGLHSADHGYWGAQLIEPYVSERVAWAVRYHQALRFYADPAVGYEYPELYRRLFGPDYAPDAYIEAAYREARAHRWYMEARLITLNDEYSFAPDAPAPLETFTEIVGRHFRQPPEGLGRDASPVAHMWRTIANPSRPV
jgi:hypothetical protein